jgi:CBS domain-containing protein
MLVKEIMSRGMEYIPPTSTLREVARKMRDLNIGLLPVVEHGKLVGMVTDRDICCRGVAEDLDLMRTEVREIMSQDIAYCYSYDTINDAVRQMEQRHIRRLAVLNNDESIAGVLSVDDVAHFSRQLAGEVLDTVRPLHH